jgi:hypothetical protein
LEWWGGAFGGHLAVAQGEEDGGEVLRRRYHVLPHHALQRPCHTHTHTHTSTDTYSHTHIHMHVHAFVHTQTHPHTHTHTNKQEQIRGSKTKSEPNLNPA